MSPLPPAENSTKRVLIACIGNIFLGDDGFGVEVAQRLISRTYPAGVHVVDFGIRGMELAYTLLDDYDTLVLVDAIQRGGRPGTVYLIEPDLTNLDPEKGTAAVKVTLDAHSMDPVKVLTFARTMGAQPIPTLLVGCEPAAFGGNEDYAEMQMGLSEPVQAAVDEAVKMIDALIEKLYAQAIVNQYNERNRSMFKLLLVIVGLVIGYMITRQIPDIQRYLKLRSM